MPDLSEDPAGAGAHGFGDAAGPRTRAGPAAAHRYDAFISYSHAADGRLAPALRNGLQRFATPWRVFRWRNPVRALRIFQDQASLSANPALWPTIENGLGSAEWFILLASPEAARSPWVEKEIGFWCLHKSPERLLIVQTDGEIAWGQAANDFDWSVTTALPRRLSTVFTDEPRWIDARWARTAAHATLRDPRFRDLVAELAAPLRGVPKDELIGEDIRQHRRLNRWRNAAVGVLTTLLIGAIGAAAVAVKQRDEALRNQSKALAALAESEAEKGSPASAARLALAALPRSISNPNRPPVAEAEYALYLAMVRNREVERITGHTGGVTSAAFSPDAQLIATSSVDGTAGIWKFGKGLIAVLRGHEGPLYDAGFSPDSHLVVTASMDRTARLWEAASGRELVVLHGHEEAVRCGVFSPDGTMVATGSEDQTARLWDARTGDERHVLRGHKKEVYAVKFSPGGRTIVTASFDGTSAFWEAATGNKVGEIAEPNAIFTAVALSPDGRTLAVASGEKARLWDLASLKEIGDLRGHDQLVNSVAFSPDGQRLVTASLDGSIRLWDAATLKEIAILRGHEETVFSATFSPDGTAVLSGSGDLTARLWDVTPRRELVTLSGYGNSVRAAGFSPDGRTALTASQDGSARLWNLMTGAITVIRGHEGPIRTAAFSPDGRIIVTGSNDKTVRTWNAATGDALRVLHGHEGPPDAVRFAPDGRTIVSLSHDDETMRLWDVASGAQTGLLNGRFSSISFGPEGRLILIGEKGLSQKGVTITKGGIPVLIDGATGKELLSLPATGLWVTATALSPDARSVAIGTAGGRVLLEDAVSGETKAILDGHKSPVLSVTFSGDGLTLASGSVDETVRLWDVATGKALTVLPGEGYYYSVAFNRESNALITGSGDNSAKIWPVLPRGQQLIDLACARVPWPLSEAQRQRFGVSEEWCTPEMAARLRAKLGLNPATVDAAEH